MSLDLGMPIWYNKYGKSLTLNDGVVSGYGEHEEEVLAQTTLSFSADSTYNTGMYCTAENAIGIGDTWRSWISNPYTKLKITWDGTDYICYFHQTEITRYDEDTGVPNGWYDWHWTGNPSRLGKYEWDTLTYPFCITMDRFKNQNEMVVWAVDSTAASHTLAISRIVGDASKAGYENFIDRPSNTFLAPEGNTSVVVGSGNTNSYATLLVGVANNIVGKESPHNDWVTVFGSANDCDLTEVEDADSDFVLIGKCNKVRGRSYSTILSGYRQTYNLGAFVNGGSNYYTSTSFIGGRDSTFNNAVQNSLIFGSNITQNGMCSCTVAVGGGLTLGTSSASIVQNSAIFGRNITTTHAGCFVAGNEHSTDRSLQIVLGQYSAADETALLKVGGGSSTERKNIFAVHTDGRATIGANGTADMDVPSVSQMNTEIAKAVHYNLLWHSDEGVNIGVSSSSINRADYPVIFDSDESLLGKILRIEVLTKTDDLLRSVFYTVKFAGPDPSVTTVGEGMQIAVDFVADYSGGYVISGPINIGVKTSKQTAPYGCLIGASYLTRATYTAPDSEWGTGGWSSSTSALDKYIVNVWEEVWES